MEILYYKDPIGNFGDDLNEWIWDAVAPNITSKESEYSLLGIGSIINKKIIKDKKVIVFGSGVAYGEVPNTEDLIIKCVRGKLSAKILGISESLAIADAAILLNLIPDYSPIPEDKKSGIIFIPHNDTYNRHALNELCESSGVELINPTIDAKYIINKIRHSKLVITEAMHGAIIADTMRVRWVPVVLSSNISTFKWLDWLSTFNIEYNPIYLGLPDLKANKRNDLMIKHKIALFKPECENINEIELLKQNKKTINYRLQRILLNIKLKFISKNTILHHKNKVMLNFNGLTNNYGYLSDDDVFYSNLKKLQQKLSEF